MVHRQNTTGYTNDNCRGRHQYMNSQHGWQRDRQRLLEETTARFSYDLHKVCFFLREVIQVCLFVFNLLPYTVKESRVKNNHLSFKKRNNAHMAEQMETVLRITLPPLRTLHFKVMEDGSVTWFRLAWPLKYSINVNNIVKAWNQSYGWINNVTNRCICWKMKAISWLYILQEGLHCSYLEGSGSVRLFPAQVDLPSNGQTHEKPVAEAVVVDELEDILHSEVDQRHDTLDREKEERRAKDVNKISMNLMQLNRGKVKVSKTEWRKMGGLKDNVKTWQCCVESANTMLF